MSDLFSTRTKWSYRFLADILQIDYAIRITFLVITFALRSAESAKTFTTATLFAIGFAAPSCAANAAFLLLRCKRNSTVRLRKSLNTLK